MRSSERNVKTNINSEIHASLRRLEDADYVNSVTQSETIGVLVDQANSANQNLQNQISNLSGEVYKLHGYISPHIKDGDLRAFSTLDVGNLTVTSGGEVTGQFKFNSGVSIGGAVGINATLTMQNGNSIVVNSFVMGDSQIYGPHTLTVEGRSIGSVLAPNDLSFNLVGLVEGVGSGDKLTIQTTRSDTKLLEFTVEPHIKYDNATHKYFAWANLKRSNGSIVVATDNAWADNESLVASGSATVSYYGTAPGNGYLFWSDERIVNTGTRTVFWQ